MTTTPSALAAPLNHPNLGYVPPGFLTGSMVQKELQVSTGEFRSIVKRKLLKAVKRNQKGWMLYRASAVADLKKIPRYQLLPTRPTKLITARDFCGGVTYDAAEGAAVFSCLREGLPLTEIVHKTGMHPTVVQAIVGDWDHLKNTVTLTGSQLDAINKLPLECALPIRTASDLVDALVAASTEHVCAFCEKRPRSKACAPCATRIVKGKIAKAVTAAEGGEVTGALNDIPLPDRL